LAGETQRLHWEMVRCVGRRQREFGCAEIGFLPSLGSDASRGVSLWAGTTQTTLAPDLDDSCAVCIQRWLARPEGGFIPILCEAVCLFGKVLGAPSVLLGRTGIERTGKLLVERGKQPLGRYPLAASQ